MSVLAVPALVAAVAAAPGGNLVDQSELARGLASCVARSAPGESRTLLTMDSNNPAFTSRLVATIESAGPKCRKKAVGMTAGASVLGGMIAEALLHSRFQPNVSADDLKVDPRNPPTPAFGTVDNMGLCGVAKAPLAASQLMNAPPGSEGESRNVAALRPIVASCLQKGISFNASTEALRALIALAAWRIVTAEKAR